MGRKGTYLINKPEKEYAEMVRVMFSRVVNRYDLMNRLLSVGLDIYWRRKTVEAINLEENERFLDLACGTGDLGIFVAKAYPHVLVFAVDFNLDMISFAKKKIEKKKLNRFFNFAAADANNLPFKDESFDAVGIAFGLRNIPNRKNALKEMIRITKKGGKILILEMTAKGTLNHIFKFYIRHVMPFLARIFSSDPDAYFYLYDTISSFSSPEELKDELEWIGLKNVKIKRFWPGITYLFVGMRP
ncbi:MAG: ubiquinone/menaquinone biosynthesis methyltransferase [Desulfobacterota bacterium]|nr:ubiquinone/menaquinone biosynthesis methyltransferase [Thermodesulfobacteriota bacterium]MDW8001298.1 ubiquinone/menaquinone biosynthesis methyltransferase [Deltaproteobacteria bacterium]